MTKPHRLIWEIANEITEDWNGKINYAAKPYLLAMFTLNTIEDNYVNESAQSIIAYFLANATTWRGETARRIKQELNDMIK